MQKGNFAGLQVHGKRGKSAHASPTPYHTSLEELSARFITQPLSALIVPRAPSYFPLSLVSFRHKSELKQELRRRLRKRHLKSEFAQLQTLSLFVKCWQYFLELNSKELYQSSRKEKESCCLVFPSSTKRELGTFTLVVL